MMPNPTSQEIRQILLEEIRSSQPKTPMDGSLQQNTVLSRVSARLQINNNTDLEQVVLAEWYGLFNTGFLAWGHNLSNSNPPFCHITSRGKDALKSLSRDPSNPAGYLAYVHSLAPLNPVAVSYLKEGLDCFVGAHYKAAAVMIGAATESLVLELRDHLVQRLSDLQHEVPPKLSDWRVKTVLDELQTFVDTRKRTLPNELREEFSSYWPAFTQQIRAVRNEAGHPSSVDPVSPETAHASFLVFPLLAQLAASVHKWIDAGLK